MLKTKKIIGTCAYCGEVVIEGSEFVVLPVRGVYSKMHSVVHAEWQGCQEALERAYKLNPSRNIPMVEEGE